MKPENYTSTFAALANTNPDLIEGNELPVPIIRVDEQDTIIFANPLAEKLLDTRKGKLLNKAFLQFVSSDDAMTYKIARQNAILSSTKQLCEVRLFTRNNEEKFCHINISGNGSILALTDRTYKRKVEDTQTFLLGNKWTAENEDFFNALAHYLSQVLKADYICIDYLHNNLEAQTISVYFDGKFEDNIKYTLRDTPCGKVLGSNICCYPQGVKFMFPKDLFLQEMNAEGYAGITLHNSHGKPIGLIAVISRKPFTDIRACEMILKQVSIRAAAELEHQITEKKFKALHKSNQAMLTSSSETEMMKKVCDIITKDCGYSMMWIGTANDDEKKSITPLVSAGFEKGYLEKLNLTWDDTKQGRGPSGCAIRTGKVSICKNTLTDPSFEPWKEEARKRGYASSIAIPLMDGPKAFGLVSIYSPQPNDFEDEDVSILVQMSNDLAQGLIALSLRNKLQKAIYELNQSNDLLEIVVEERTIALRQTNKKLQEEITVRKKNENLLRKAEEKYRIVADHTYHCESWLGTDGTFNYISPSFKEFTGYDPDEFMKDSSLYYRIAHPDDRKLVEDHFNEIIFPNNHICNLKYRIVTRDGKIKKVEHTCKPVFNEDGEWMGQRGSMKIVD